MRVTEIELLVGEEKLLSFRLGEPDPFDRYQVKGVFGLDADEIVPIFYGFGINSNDKFYRMSMKPREIAVRVVPTPNWTNGEDYGTIRDQLYRGIAKDRTGKVRVNLKAGGSNIAYTEGLITKFEAPLFNQDPEIQITLMCNDPFFRSPYETVYLAEDLGNDGYISIPDIESTAPHGVEMKITYLRDTQNFVMQSDGGDQEFFVEFPFFIFDELYVNSEPNQRHLYADYGGITFALMDRLKPTSVWPLIFPGANEFYLPGLAAGDFRIDYIKFTRSYWGV